MAMAPFDSDRWRKVSKCTRIIGSLTSLIFQIIASLKAWSPATSVSKHTTAANLSAACALLMDCSWISRRRSLFSSTLVFYLPCVHCYHRQFSRVLCIWSTEVFPMHEVLFLVSPCSKYIDQIYISEFLCWISKSMMKHQQKLHIENRMSPPLV